MNGTFYVPNVWVLGAATNVAVSTVAERSGNDNNFGDVDTSSRNEKLTKLYSVLVDLRRTGGEGWNPSNFGS